MGAEGYRSFSVIISCCAMATCCSKVLSLISIENIFSETIHRRRVRNDAVRFGIRCGDSYR